MAEAIELGRRHVELCAFGDLEGGGLVGRRTVEVAQRVLALVGLEINRTLRMVRDFQAQIVGGEFGRAVEIRGAEPHVADVLQLDHGGNLPFTPAWSGRCGRARRR